MFNYSNLSFSLCISDNFTINVCSRANNLLGTFEKKSNHFNPLCLGCDIADNKCMVKHCVKWKSIKDESSVDISLPLALEDHYRGTLLPRIFAMPQKTPITFDKAITLTSKIQKKAFFDGQLGIEPGQNGWYTVNFIDWISSLGFHIEITGDEFDCFAMSDKIF